MDGQQPHPAEDLGDARIEGMLFVQATEQPRNSGVIRL